MSGPKVVRVITREELEALGRGQIAAVDAAIAQVRETLRRFSLQEKALEAALVSRHMDLVGLLEQGRFADLQRQAAAQAAYFQAEAARLEAKAIAAIEASKSRRRRLSDAARTLISALEASGKAPSAELREVVSTSLSANDATFETCQRVIDVAFKALANAGVSTADVTERQAELAKRLGAGGKTQSFTEWLANQPVAAEPHTARLDQVLAELELRGDTASIETFSRRAAVIAAEASVSQRRLLTDSLILDASAALKQSKAAAGLRAQLHELHGALSAYSTQEARTAAQAIETDLAKPGAFLDPALVAVASAAIEQAQRQLAAAARRRAVLTGLATLGYEIRENMASAWARDGRLVVRKPGATDYGVELAAPADTARLQLRLVGAQIPAQPRSTVRDRDHEVSWCSEFSQLQDLVANAGGNVQIERAIAVGAQAVKTVRFENIFQDATEAGTRIPVERKL